jgi:Cu-processing system permease protein
VSVVAKLLGYQLRDALRSRSIVGYALFLALATSGLLHFGGGVERALPSLATLVVLIVPLVGLLITTSFVYHSGDFIELLLTHPVGRRPLFVGLYTGLAVPLVGAFLVGTLAPLAVAGGFVTHAGEIGLLALAGALLTMVFTSLGFLIALRVGDATRGMGIALLIWLALAVLYDGLVLLAAYRWAAYPLEKPMLALMALNPVDLARVLVIMALDASAMMGYTGAVFQDFFGGLIGLSLAVASLVLWSAIPGMVALRTFRKKDF